MGTLDVKPDMTSEAVRCLTKALLDDLRALEQVLESGMAESGMRRIGAEQTFLEIAHDLLTERLEGR